VEHQTFGVATEYPSSLAVDQFPPDGVMGMAFPSLSVYPANPFFQTLINEGAVDKGAFSFKLATSGSALFLGGADSALYAGSFTYAPVTQQVSCGFGVFSTISDIDRSGFLASELG
jgi:cathepsin D